MIGGMLRRAAPQGRLDHLRQRLGELRDQATADAIAGEVAELQAMLDAGCVPAPRKFMLRLAHIERRFLQALADDASAAQDAARTASKAARQAQAEHDAVLVAELFAAAWRQGLGRVGLQAAAAAVLREREHRLQEQLITAQQVGNKALQRQHSAGLQALQRLGVLCTLHRAGKWLQQRTSKP